LAIAVAAVPLPEMATLTPVVAGAIDEILPDPRFAEDVAGIAGVLSDLADEVPSVAVSAASDREGAGTTL